MTASHPVMIVVAVSLCLLGNEAIAQNIPEPRRFETIPRGEVRTLPTEQGGESSKEEASEQADDVAAGPVVRKFEAPAPKIGAPDLLKSKSAVSSPPQQTTVTVTGPTGDPRYSAITGTAAGNTRIIDLEDTFISGIMWREKNNKPCNFQFWTLDHDFGGKDWSPCTGFGATPVFDTGHEVRLEQGTAIGRIQVCESGGSKRIKGIRIYGDRINEDGTTTYHPAMAKDDLANCSTWKQDVLCPTGTLSTGIVIHFVEGSTPAATGLQLVCRAVGVRTEVVESEKAATVPFEPLEIKPVLKPAVIATNDTSSRDGKGDKGNDVMETTPGIRFAGGSPRLTSVSGRNGESAETFDLGQRALNRIGWREKFDKPCEVNLLSVVEGEDIWARIIQRCTKDSSFACEEETCKGTGVYLNQTHGVRLEGKRTGITSIRVCVNGRSNGRVKGLEIRGAEILDTGTLSSNLDISKDTLAHCSEWEPFVLCPSGSVATGVRAHFDEGSGASRNVDQLVGLQLACRRILTD